ncbi:MFS transporter [Clostridium lundense]|uniref:MFS transporter n=1 Tax=Clostridium lundense TaxID=319475 RepID=UPI0006881AB3|nr:MFS transporter [Clostridium lundense]
MENLQENDIDNEIITKKQTLWTSQFIYLSIANFFFFLSFEMLLPTLPVYISQCGGSDSIVGIIMGMFTISAIIIRPFSDTAMPGFSRKKSLMLGSWICVVTTIGYYLSKTVGIILVDRILHGFGFGLVTTLLVTIVTNSIPNERMGEGIGYFGLGSTIAMSLGSFLGIWVLNSFKVKGLFTFAAILVVIAIIFMCLISKDEGPKLNRKEKKKVKLDMSSFFEPKALVPSILIMLLGFSYGGILGFIALFGRQVGISNVGWFFMGVAICEIIVRLFVGKIFDTKGPAWVLIPGAVFALIGTIILAKISNNTNMMISSLFYGIGFGALFPSLQALTINIVPEDKRNLASATFYNAFDLGIGGGTIILGLVVQLTSYSDMFLYSSLLFVVYLIIYVSYLIKNRGYR